MNNDERDLLRKITEARRVALLCHVSPDCDTLGTSLALAEAIRTTGKQAVVFSDEPLTEKQMILCGAQEIVRWHSEDPAYDLGILVDCSYPERVGECARVLEKCGQVSFLDHHVEEPSQEFCSGWRNIHASCTGEMACRLIQDMGVSFTVSMAANLYMAISTDTGHFSYDNTTADTHRAVAELIEAGANSSRLTEWLYRRTTAGYTYLLGRVLSTLELFKNAKAAILSCEYSWFKACGAQEGEIEGMINFARDISSVEIAAILRETADGSIRVSFRSKRRVDVQKLASSYGGGGHVRASGCTLIMSLEQAKKEIREALSRVLESS